MNYLVTYGQTIYDIALSTYGSSEYVYKLIQDNTFIDSVDYDFDANPGKVIYWDETLVTPQNPELNQVEETTPVDLDSVIATNGQSIYDICLMTYGDLGYLYKLITDNNLIGPNDRSLSGKVFIFNPSLIADKGMYNHLKLNKKVINTSDGTKKAYNTSFNISFH